MSVPEPRIGTVWRSRRSGPYGRVFAAIDFETANSARDSACALAVVRVENERIVAKRHWLIRPPTRDFEFTWLHGLSWADVRTADSFADVWAEAWPVAEGAEFIAAHNASFDRSVLMACTGRAGIRLPETRFECSMLLARRMLGIYPTRLSDVCRHLGIPLRHHDALSDAVACARIVLAAARRTRVEGR